MLPALATVIFTTSCDPVAKDNAEERSARDSMKKEYQLATPDEALAALEAAYIDKDIERAIACKDFEVEAEVLLRDHPKVPKSAITPEYITEIAATLKQEFRLMIERDGFPKFSDLKCRVVDKRPYSYDKVWVVTEECLFPDSGTSRQEILMALTESGWRVLNPIYEKEPNKTRHSNPH